MTPSQSADEAAFIRKLNSALPIEKRLPLPERNTRPATGPQTKYQSPPDEAEALDALSNSGYAQKVISNLGVENDHLWDLLLHPVRIRRTHSVLVRKRAATLRDVERPRSDNSTAKQRNARIRAFLELIDKRINEVEDQLGDNPLESQRRIIKRLATAIRQHRDETTRQGLEPEPWDERLWQVLNEITPGR